jgi:hypothetical protein
MTVNQVNTNQVTTGLWWADTSAELTSSIGANGDMAIGLDNGKVFYKSAGAWVEKGATTQQHAQSHDHSAAGDGTSLSPATLIIPGATSPAQTAEGSAVWDTDDDRLTIGTGAARKTFLASADEMSSGTLASRPAAAFAGRMYFATDVVGGVLYLDTGSAWVMLSDSSAATIASVVTFNGTSQAGGTDVTLWTPWTIPANFLTVGSTFTLELGLDIDILNSVTARNLVFKIKLGATAVATLTSPVKVSTANANKSSIFKALIGFTTIGASGVCRVQGLMPNAWASTATDNFGVFGSAVSPATVDTTGALAVTVTVNESVNSVADLVRAETGGFTLAKV